MTVKTVRKIVIIDEEKCNGCGICVPSCAEGALKIIDGKARLVSEIYCDGLGACLGKCPQDAITVEERVAQEFDEKAVELYHELKEQTGELACGCPSATVTEFEEHDAEPLACGCSSAMVQEIGSEEAIHEHEYIHHHQPTTLRHWPVQLTLVTAKATFLQGADVLLTADCVPFAYGGFHQDFLKDHALLVACPKLDDFDAHLEKLTQVIANSGLKSLTVVHMEVPCCSGLVMMAKKAIQASGKKIPLKDVTIGMRGEIKA
jgi:NAD-dependent dihydropyrimidine dehydrogenase PreA subunit